MIYMGNRFGSPPPFLVPLLASPFIAIKPYANVVYRVVGKRDVDDEDYNLTEAAEGRRDTLLVLGLIKSACFLDGKYIL